MLFALVSFTCLLSSMPPTGCPKASQCFDDSLPSTDSSQGRLVLQGTQREAFDAKHPLSSHEPLDALQVRFCKNRQFVTEFQQSKQVINPESGKSQ